MFLYRERVKSIIIIVYSVAQEPGIKDNWHLDNCRNALVELCNTYHLKSETRFIDTTDDDGNTVGAVVDLK